MTTTAGDDTLFAEGQRSVLLHIFSMLRLTDADLVKMAGQTTLMDEDDE